MGDVQPQYDLRPARCLLLVLSLVLVSGCSTIGYYYQSARGQLDLMSRARDIDAVLDDDAVAPEVRRKLEQVAEMRRFASRTLHLPDNDSYTRYADLEREYAIWNVFAAPELSVEPRQWCFPIAGCVVYRGYFSRDGADAYAATLREEGLDTAVLGVPAYSTLGWFDDPVVSTVLGYSRPELAGLIFHELAHQVAYAKGDSVFNESFATVVEIEGVERWLRARGRRGESAGYRLQRRRDGEVVEMILGHRERLDAVYHSGRDRAWKLARKSEIIASLKARYAHLTAGWEDYHGYRHWFVQDLNNAHFAVIAAYYDLVPAFRALLARHDGDLESFYDAVTALSERPENERDAFLRSLAPPPPLNPE